MTYMLEIPGTEGSKRLAGFFTATDLRREIDKLAHGKPWGWRATTLGAEAVCDYAVIAVATEIN